MDKQQAALALAEELLGDIEFHQLEASDIVLKASRLARLVGHDELAKFTDWELNGYSEKGEDRNKYLSLAGRWNIENGEKTFHPVPITKLEALADSLQLATESMRVQSISGDHVTVATREMRNQIATYAKELAEVNGIQKQVVSSIYRMVYGIYYELVFSEIQSSLFAATQEKVDGALAESSGSALKKIESVNERLRDGSEEAISQAMLTCRRLIDSVADAVFPARDDPYVLGEEEIRVGQNNVLNRLKAFVNSQAVTKGREDRLRRSLNDIYDRVSGGVHSEVTPQEAQFLFLNTYIVLGEILTLKDSGRDV